MDQIRKIHAHLTRRQGMTLIEVMISIFLFAVFITAFMTGQGNNVSTSFRMKDDLLLKDLAENQYNLTLLTPPDFNRPVPSVKSETKPIKDYPEYEYTMSYRQIFIPDVAKIMGTQDNPNDPDQQNRKRVMQEFKDNMERLVWQISVEVRNKTTGATFEVSGWTYYDKARVAFRGF